VAAELDLPVYFYGEAARLPGRRELPSVRRGGFEGLRAALEADPLVARERRPDLGPARLHPTAGAVTVGARGFLVAYNVELASRDLELARSIARSIRASAGGLPGVRALGMALATRGCVQVSMNLCAPERTGIEAAYRAVERMARAGGVDVGDSELVGLAPASVLDEHVAGVVRLRGFDPGRQVLERAVAGARRSGERVE
jgi:glutamate formiminotransferase